MFIHFLCLCPLRLAIMLNFNTSKVAYFFLCLHFQRDFEVRHIRMRITLLITSTTVVESRELFEFGEEMKSFRAGDSVLPFSVFLHD